MGGGNCMGMMIPWVGHTSVLSVAIVCAKKNILTNFQALDSALTAEQTCEKGKNNG
jgi:hypothetical protein